MRGLQQLLIITFCLASLQVFAQEKKNQLEELFIWKTSDELKLNAVEEKKFTDIVKSLNKKKADLNQSLHDSVEKIAALKTNKEKESELARYRKDLAAYSKISEEEYDKLKTLLGTERLSQYLKLKQDLTGRIKSLLANPDANKTNDKNALPAPKVIVE